MSLKYCFFKLLHTFVAPAEVPVLRFYHSLPYLWGYYTASCGRAVHYTYIHTRFTYNNKNYLKKKFIYSCSDVIKTCGTLLYVMGSVE